MTRRSLTSTPTRPTRGGRKPAQSPRPRKKKTPSATALTGDDCQKCGLCCVPPYGQDRFADVTEQDEARLGRKYVRLNVIHTSPFDVLVGAMGSRIVPQGALKTKTQHQYSGPLKGMTFATCVALKGSLMEKVSCSIYEKRPSVCRTAVVPGDHTCLAIREGYKRYADDR